MGFLERMRTWKDAAVADARKRWWGLPVLIVAGFLWNMIFARMIDKANHFVDTHATPTAIQPILAFLGGIGPPSSFWRGALWSLIFCVLALLVLVVHAYLETRPRKGVGPASMGGFAGSLDATLIPSPARIEHGSATLPDGSPLSASQDLLKEREELEDQLWKLERPPLTQGEVLARMVGRPVMFGDVSDAEKIVKIKQRLAVINERIKKRQPKPPS
ncbi:MAG: hypothetical protein ABR973_13980 [Candidatus Acidiferrales bacterium]|jgi:hypothetical protein